MNYCNFTEIIYDSISFLIHLMNKLENSQYHQQQNKWYPKGVYLPISKLHFISDVANLLAHNNITIRYHGQVNWLRLKSSVASKWENKHLWGSIYFAVDGTHNIVSSFSQTIKFLLSPDFVKSRISHQICVA